MTTAGKSIQECERLATKRAQQVVEKMDLGELMQYAVEQLTEYYMDNLDALDEELADV